MPSLASWPCHRPGLNDLSGGWQSSSSGERGIFSRNSLWSTLLPSAFQFRSTGCRCLKCHETPRIRHSCSDSTKEGYYQLIRTRGEPELCTGHLFAILDTPEHWPNLQAPLPLPQNRVHRAPALHGPSSASAMKRDPPHPTPTIWETLKTENAVSQRQRRPSHPDLFTEPEKTQQTFPYFFFTTVNISVVRFLSLPPWELASDYSSLFLLFFFSFSFHLLDLPTATHVTQTL